MATRTVIQRERKTREIPPLLAGILSAIAPGLGQILIGYWERGVYLFTATVTTIALTIWRISVIAYRQETWAERLPVAFRRKPLLYFLVVIIFILIISNIIDAYKLARHRLRNRRLETLSHILIGLLIFTLGWQIVEINLVKLATELPDTFPIISKIAWPWPSAFIKDEEILQGEEFIYTDCEGKEFPDSTVDGTTTPYIVAAPRCGELSGYEEVGTMLSVDGYGFRPSYKPGRPPLLVISNQVRNSCSLLRKWLRPYSWG